MKKTAACRCGHAAGAHEHFTPARNCALCECRKFRRRLTGTGG